MDRLRSRSRAVLFVLATLLLAALLAWMSTRHPVRIDTTAQAVHSLSAVSADVVLSLEGVLRVDAWLEPDAGARAAVRRVIDRYRQHKTDITLRYINPQTSPALAREKAIRPGGELILAWRDREQRIHSLTERSLTYAMMRLSRETAPVVRFVSGHLERQPDSPARHGYQQFAQHLRTLGFEVEALSLITTPVVPADTDVLVIAAPSGDYFPGESASVLNYLASGGNLLWALDSNQPIVPVELAAELGLSVLPGVIVDVASRQLAVDTPDFAVIDNYPAHPALPERLPITLFPQAVGLTFPVTFGWQLEPLLTTGAKSWTETGPIAGSIRFDENTDERAGPITLGATLRRDRGDGEQRVAVIGDADFLANSWLGNGGNMQLGQRLLDWLGGHRPLPAIAPLRAADAQLILSKRAIAALGLGFLVVLPGGLLLKAFLCWRNRAT